MKVLKADPQGGSLNVWIRYKKRNGAVEMWDAPLISQKAMYKDWIFEFGCWLREFRTFPTSDVLDKTVWGLGSRLSPKTTEMGAWSVGS